MFKIIKPVISKSSFSSVVLPNSCKKTFTRNYNPRRAVMYVPGDDIRKLSKIKTLTVDSVALDCEDGVALNKKTIARENILKYLNESSIGRKSEIAVRVNSIESDCCEADLNTILSGKTIPKTLLLPKVHTIDDIQNFSDKLEKILNKHCHQKAIINLIICAESCQAIVNLVEICRGTKQIGERKNLFNLVAIMFGSDDFCATLGAIRTEDSQEILYARQKVVLTAKAFDLQAIDMVYIEYNNLAGLRVQSEFGAKMGYTGMQVIHPGQIDTVQEIFTPSKQKIQWATELMLEFDKHQISGKGAFVFEKKMIDMPTMKQARNIVRLSKAIGE